MLPHISVDICDLKFALTFMVMWDNHLEICCLST